MSAKRGDQKMTSKIGRYPLVFAVGVFFLIGNGIVCDKQSPSTVHPYDIFEYNPFAGRERSAGAMRLPPYGPQPIPGQLIPGLPPHLQKMHHIADHAAGMSGKPILTDMSLHYEDECEAHCKEHVEFECRKSCTCVPMIHRCDGKPDCAPGEDEYGCTQSCEETDKRVLCPTTHTCILKIWLCDGDNDCGDYSDETHCGEAKSCAPNQFQCDNGLCINKGWRCDRDNDCNDSSDEVNCTLTQCTTNEFQCGNGQCIARHWVCDKEQDCSDASDELNCPMDMYQCLEDMFQCRDRKCVTKEFQCDGDNDCGDWSDEVGCALPPTKCTVGEFDCGDGKCIPADWRCDHENDCINFSDEKECTPATTRTCAPDEHTCNDQRCIKKSWVCDGVPDCITGEDEVNCQLKCEPDQYTCQSDSNRTNAYQICLKKKHVCDGMTDCPRGDDELDCPTYISCPTNTTCEKFCINTTRGQLGCACPNGYELAANGQSCNDIDECLYSQDPVCSQTCSNMMGSFSCGCMTGYVLRPDLRSCKATGGAPTLLFTNRIEIRQVELENDRYTSVLKNLHNAVALDYHYEKNLIFWSENTLNVIRVSPINNPNATDVIRWGLESPSGVAVDWVHNLLFWADSGTRRVEVSSLDGRDRALIAASDLDKPRAIAVHPGDALVFWTDWGPSPKIERADMDGSNRKSVVIDQIFWPNGLTIDYPASRIYWADAKHHVIESSTFDGRERRKVTNKGLPHPYAITVFEDALYWTDWHTKTISTVNKKTGAGLQNIHEGISMLMDIRSYHPLRQPSFDNRCGRINGGCSHLCLPNSHSYTCHCPLGYSLNSDKRTCDQTPEKLLLFARKKDIRLKHLHPTKQSDSFDMVIPVERIKSAVALDWDHISNSIFWSDVETDSISSARIDGSSQKLIVSTNLISPSGIAYDWINNKLYWTDSGTNRLEVANTDGSMRAVLAWQDIDKPRDIVLDPIGGIMYWSDWGVNACIEKANMDGQSRNVLIKTSMKWPNGLALDFTKAKIYWTDGGRQTIEFANFDGSGRTTLIDDLPHPFGLDLSGDEVIWSDWKSISIQAANKSTGDNRRTLGAGLSGLMDVRVFHKERRRDHNRCGGAKCSHLCLLKPAGYSCACPIGILQLNDTTCRDEPHKYLLLAHRVAIRILSLDTNYVIDVVKPVKGLKNALSVDIDRLTGDIFWTDTAVKKIQKVAKDSDEPQVIIDHGFNSSDGIAIDSTGRKIYWTDAGKNTIEVANLDGSYRKILFWKNLYSPRGIALYYGVGIMFWCDWGIIPKIERSDMDGTRRKAIVSTGIGWPNALAIDFPNNRIYWTDSKQGTIETATFDGTHRFVFQSKLQHPYGIAVAEDYIYWGDWKTKTLNKVYKLAKRDAVVIREQLEGLMDVKLVDKDSEHYQRTQFNDCNNNNNGCSHLCLRSSVGFSCACPTGLKFRSGSKKICKKHPDEFLVFANGNGLSFVSFDTPEMSDVLMSTKGIRNAIAVDFHWGRKLLLYTDVELNVIKSVNMNDPSDINTIISTDIKKPNGLAVDWSADNIYWSDNEKKVLEVARIDGSSRKVIIKNLHEPRSLAVFPRMGYLFWTDWGENSTIERSMLDGSKRKVIRNTGLGLPNGLAIDYSARRLYWTDSLRNRIVTSNLDGEHEVQLVADAKHPFGLTQFGDWIYWTDWYHKSIQRANKNTGSNITTITANLETVNTNNHIAMELKAVSPVKQPGRNPCSHGNGYCTHLCLFYGNGYACACPDIPTEKICIDTPTERNIDKWVDDFSDYPDYKDDVYHNEPDDSSVHEFSIVSVMIYMSVAVGCLLCAIGLLLLIAKKRGHGPAAMLKEEFRSPSAGRHISFPNPNYNGSQAAEINDRRTNRFQIFKYDRAQERVTNLYVPEGAQLLPNNVPPPPRPPPDDFHTVTLHPIA